MPDIIAQFIVMKKLILLFASVVLLVTGCQTDNTTDKTTGDTSSHTFTISLQQTRTSLGDKEGKIYPVYWSAEDQIVVNGIPSKSISIDENNASKATFTVSPTPTSPYCITYPYIEQTSDEQPLIEFPAEQSYCVGSFAVGSAPMCGYATNADNISLSHLASVLKIPVKSKLEGVVLEKIVITANNAIAGTFEVDCQSTTITPTKQSVKSITYTLPANFELLTTEINSFYISLAGVEVNECKIEFIEASGEKMTALWAPNKVLSKGVVQEFNTVTYEQNSSYILQPLAVEEDELEVYHNKVYGYIRYSDGSPISGVAVSDGFQVVKTNSKGYYEISNVTPQSWYIYCSLPADVAVPTNEYGQPCFFKKYPASSSQFDFTFEKLAGGKESEFVLFGLADTQPSSMAHLDRFNIQAAPEIKSYSKSLKKPCYGIVLGDMVGSKPEFMPDMRAALAKEKTGLPIFACYGNHDHILCNNNYPTFPDKRNKDFNIKLQRAFEECFGPVNYSFNRGDVHIISMRNVLNTSSTSVSAYKTALTPEQFEWLKQDLALVPKDKMVLFCVHIPILNGGKLGDGSYRQEILAMLDEYAEAHILSGHTHYMRPYDYVWNKTGHNIYEHCISSTRQDMMDTNIHRDGTPCGYNIFKIKNNQIVDWYYKGYPHGMNTRDDQMRLYRGATIIGAEPSGSNKYGTMGFYQLPFNNSTLLANIFSSDPSWKVEVYEDGVYSGDMTYFYNISNSDYDKLEGDGSYENPRRVTEGLVCSRDFWAIGILYGYLGSEVNNNYNSCYTMWRYTLKNPDAKHIEVRATDRFGYVYSEDKITDNTNSDYAFYDPQYNPTIE